MANDPKDNSNGIFPYKPSQAAAIGAAALFGISTLYHLLQMMRKKTWFYSAFVIGGFMMTLGYAARLWSAKNPSEILPYSLQSLFIILPPSLYAATIYMIYGRIVLFVQTPAASIIRPTRVTKIFVTGDVLAFFVQAGAGGMMVQIDTASLGEKLMIGGLLVQLFFFGFFLVVSLVFWKRMHSSPARYTIPVYGKHGWQALLKLMLGAALIIILRCIFRLIEFSQGHDGYLISHEIFLYIFDTAPMLLVQVMFHIIHAGDVFPRNLAMSKLDGGSEVNIGLQERV